jgi:hypothetical protein
MNSNALRVTIFIILTYTHICLFMLMIHLHTKFQSFGSLVAIFIWKAITYVMLRRVAILHYIKQLPVFDRRYVCWKIYFMSAQFLGTCIIEYLRRHRVHLKVYEYLSLDLENTDLRTHEYDTIRTIKSKIPTIPSIFIRSAFILFSPLCPTLSSCPFPQRFRPNYKPDSIYIFHVPTAERQIAYLLLNLIVHYHDHKWPSVDPILSRINPSASSHQVNYYYFLI